MHPGGKCSFAGGTCFYSAMKDPQPTSAKAAFMHQGQARQPAPKPTSAKAAMMHQGQDRQPPSPATSPLAAMRANHLLAMQALLKRTMAGKVQPDITPVPALYRPYIRFANKARDVGFVVSSPAVAGLSTIKEYNMFREWHEGYGPQYRLFLDEHPMTRDMQKSYGVQEARRYFYLKYKKDWMAGDFVNNVTRGNIRGYKAGFGPIDMVRAGLNLTEQFVGNFRVDIFIVEGGRNLLFRVADSKSRSSFYYHIQGFLGDFSPPGMNSRERVLSVPEPESNTYQTYMWKERNIYYLDRP